MSADAGDGGAGGGVAVGTGTAIWSAVPDLEAQNKAPLVDPSTSAHDSSTAIGSSPSAEPSPIVNPNPAALAGVKFKTTYEFELDLSAKLFLFLVVLEISFFIFDRAYISPPEDSDGMWLLGCMIITAVFFGWFSVRAVWYELKYDLVVCLLISVMVSVRAILEYTWICEHTTWVCITLLAVVGVAQVGYVILGVRVYQQMGRRFFKKARIADPAVHRAFFAYQKLSAALKLDVVVVLVLIFTGLFYSSKDSVIAGIVLSSAFLVCEWIWESVGLYYARKEDRRVSQIFRYVGLIVPVIYLVVLSTLFSREHYGNDQEEGGTSLLSPFTKFITVAFLGVGIRGLVIWASYNYDKHMGNGLREHFFDKGLE